MFRRTLFAVAAFASLVSTVQARPVVDFLQPTNNGFQSQERTVGNDYRAADDFMLTALFGSVSVTSVSAVMIGPQTPTAANFGMTVYRNQSLLLDDHPGTVLKSRSGASSVTNLGTAGVPGVNKYLVTFTFAPGAFIAPSNTRLWLSVYGRNADTRTWNFAHRSTLALPLDFGFAARTKVNTNAWVTPPLPARNLAFRIVAN